MTTNLDRLATILEENNLTTADIEFIANYLNTEKISPQLAMRRIKSFEQLQQKLDNPEDKNRIFELNTELTKTKEELRKKEEELNNLLSEKTGLESEKKELETKSALLDSERDELQRQLQMLQEIKFDEPEQEERDLETRLEQFIDILGETIETHTEANTFLMPIKLHLSKILEDPNSINFEKDAFKSTISEVISKLSPEQVKSQKEAVGFVKRTPSFSSDAGEQTGGSKVTVPTTNESIKSKDDDKKKEEEIDPRKEKENQVLNLFLEFVEEADNDASFKERVSTICEMDEAYEYLGSIGLSQVYSFSSRGVDKKSDLLKLLRSWKKDGVPR